MQGNTLKHSILSSLLNDDSFIDWLRGDGNFQEKRRWERWLEENPENEILLQKVEKLLNIPFSNPAIPDIEEELARLEAAMSEIQKQ